MDVSSDVRLEIGELVLDGLEGVDPAAVGEAVRVELARRLAEGTLPPAWRAPGGAARLRVPPLEVPAGADTAAVGAAIAGALVRGGAR